MADTKVTLHTDDGLAFEALAELTESVEPFTPGASFWTDPYISDQLLEAHLDPDREAASRPHDRIDEEVEWLVSALDLTAGDAILDLGCGPGLYCERFHDRGFSVTGVDLSAEAIECARRRASNGNRSITYRQADYRTMAVGSEYDAVMLVYFDFGTFGRRDRSHILATVRDALKVGGRFAFDVYNDRALETTSATTEWNLRMDGGFWRPDQHIVLTETRPYPADMASLDQHTVIDTTGTATVYRFWEQYFDRSMIETMLDDSGLELETVTADLRGTPVTVDAETYGVVATVSEKEADSV